MASVKYQNVKVIGIKTVVPEQKVSIDDQLEAFGNDPAVLERAKKKIGYGTRYVAASNTTVCDMACSAAEMLLTEMSVSRNEIDLLVFVNQNPDYLAPCDACVAHGRLNLDQNCMTIDINLGCSGWPHAMMTAHALMASGGIRKGLVLAGDLPTHKTDPHNRGKAHLFGDAASATLLAYAPDSGFEATFVCGSDGKGFDALISPFGGMKHPITKEVLDYSTTDAAGNVWHASQSVMRGDDVFNFTRAVAPKLIIDTLAAAGWEKDSVDLYAIHQANKMIVSSIVKKSGIPADKAPDVTFSRYANNSTNSTVTVICDQLDPNRALRVLACGFGVGLSWGAAALNLSQTYNGGVSTYTEKKPAETTAETLNHYAKIFRGEP